MQQELMIPLNIILAQYKSHMLGEAQNTAIFNYGYYLEGTARTQKKPQMYMEYT